METETEYVSNCSNTTVRELLHLNLARGITATLCFAVCLVLVAYIVFQKALKTFLQRLLFYLTMAVQVQLGAQVLQLTQYPVIRSNNGSTPTCEAIGFVSQWSICVVQMFVMAIAFTLMLKVCSVYHHFCHQASIYRVCEEKGTAVLLEVAMVALCVVFPLTFIWVPFLGVRYGLLGPWCWITGTDESCKEVGAVYKLLLSYGPVAMVDMISLCVVAYTVASHALAHLKHKHITQHSALTRSAVVLMLLIFGAFIVHIFIWNTHTWLVDAILFPCSFLLVVLAFFNYLYSLHRLVGKQLRKVFRKQQGKTMTGIKKQESERVYLIHSSTEPPSETHYSPPYTCGFPTSYYIDTMEEEAEKRKEGGAEEGKEGGAERKEGGAERSGGGEESSIDTYIVL